jgi:hypothetical protein
VNLVRLVTLVVVGLWATTSVADDAVDATSLDRKVLCGYQGWFRTPGDASGRGWVHWSRDRNRVTPSTVTIEMWPDVSEYPAESLRDTEGFTLPDGRPAKLFSSLSKPVVDKHFDWLHDYGLDGVLVQRFVTRLQDAEDSTLLLKHVRDAARRTGRVFAVEYDLSGMPSEQIVESVTVDWHRLVDELRLTADERYLHHIGRPVVGIFGFFPDRFDADVAHRLLDVFQADEKYAAHVIGGTPWHWRRDAAAESQWGRAMRRFGTIAPWNVGNVDGPLEARRAKTSTWSDDRDEARRAGMRFMPVVYPGFGWDNLKRLEPGTSTIGRRGGAFLWEQFVTASELNADCVKVAMFDEVDEATAIFKVTNTPPREGRFLTYDGYSSDWYLRVVGEATTRFHLGPVPLPMPKP